MARGLVSTPAPVTEKAATIVWFLLFRRLLLLIGSNGGRCGVEWHGAQEKPISAIDGLQKGPWCGGTG
jgi:hypothetical protein